MRIARWTIAACIAAPCIALGAAFAAERSARSPRAPLYSGSEPAIAQVSPAIRRARQPRFIFHRRWRRPSFIDALLQPPAPATEPVLREAGVPIVPGVPPIVILQPRGGRIDDREIAIRAQQQQ